MKKSFTLKAFAFGVAAALGLSANATAPQAVKIDKEMASPVAIQATKDAAKEMNLGLTINPQLTKSSRENAMKVAAHRAEPSWGEWTDGGEMKVTDYMNEREVTLTYQIALDNANEGNFKVKVPGFFKYNNTTGCDPVILVEADPANPGEYMAFTESVYDLGWEAKVNTNNGQVTWNVYWGDHYTVLKYFVANGEEIPDATVESWKNVSYYLPDEGKIMIQGVYLEGNPSSEWFGYTLVYSEKDSSGNVVAYYYDKFFRQGADFKNYDYTLGYKDGYFSHEKNAKTGTFTMPIELNDCGDLYIGMFKSLTATTARTYVQGILAVINGDEGATLPQDIIKVTQKNGNIELPLTLNDPYTKGAKKLLYVLLFKDGDYYYSNYSTNNGLTNITVSLTADDLDYYSAGTAEYKDGTLYDMLPWVFGMDEDGWEAFVEEMANDDIELPEEYVVTVPLQASTANAGKYRLVHPYYEYYTNYMSSLLDYDGGLDFLNLDIPTSDKVTVLQSNNGLYWQAQSGLFTFNYGSVNTYSETSFTASADCYGTLADGKITFPEPMFDGQGQTAANIVAPLGWGVGAYDSSTGVAEASNACNLVYESGESYIKGNFTPAAGINTVAADAADANAPVEYFNLLGVRVANPEAGQLLIKRQGSSVEKVIVR